MNQNKASKGAAKQLWCFILVGVSPYHWICGLPQTTGIAAVQVNITASDAPLTL